MPKRLPKILLIDSNALIHRSFHALPPLTTSKGEQVNAVYGFASTLLKAIKDEQPDYIVACFDAGRKTFRNDIFDGYKAKRKETDHSLTLQIPRVKQIVETLNIPLYAQQGVEADDLIGSLARIATGKGLSVVVVTGDNDALQLVNDNVSVYSLRRGVTDTLSYDRQAVKDKTGVYPEQIVDYKALAGDSSDNIPGAPGIGQKTAVELLSKYSDLEGVYKNLDELKERTRKILTENRSQVEMSRDLAQIREDLDIELDLERADVGSFEFSEVTSLFAELDFKSLLAKLPKDTKKSSQSSLFHSNPSVEQFSASLPYRYVTSVVDAKKLLNELSQKELLVIDTETVDLGGELIGVAFAWSSQDSCYLPLAPAYSGGVIIEDIKDDLRKLLEDKKIKKIGHNLKYDLAVLRRSGFKTESVYFDTMIASQLASSQLYSHRLDDVALSELGFRKISISSLIGPKKDKSMAEVDIDKLSAYSCEDVLITWRLFEHYRKDVEISPLKRIFYEIEMPLLKVLEQMEADGIKLDRPYLKTLSVELGKKLSSVESEIHRQVGEKFNIASPIQLKKIIFEKLKLPATGIKKVKSGYSTDADSLDRLKDKHPVIEMILEYRELSKLLNTYIESLPKLLDEDDRVHTNFVQLGAATGRLSSNNPNLQNIPIRTELGHKVRRAFIADNGSVLLGADYSQAELRVLAHISEDEQLISAFGQSADFHAEVAKKLNVDRRSAKAINFGIIYGLGANALARDLGISSTQARQFIDKYFETFPGVLRFIERMKHQARDSGYVETVFGRRRYLPDINSPNPRLSSAAERMAVNMPAQGTVADLMKLAMIRIAPRLPSQARMLLQIHDELLFEVDKGHEQEVAQIVKEEMSSVAELRVDMIVDVRAGPNWAEMKPLS